MSLSRVRLSNEVFLVISMHALTSEREEVMGLCLGAVDQVNNVCNVWGVCHLERSDRRTDRVEISPEQLSLAAMEAERITAQTGRQTSVVGWYHSHPHMTCFPSHVDLRYQGDYQMLEPGFIGLIFSVFNEDGSYKNRVQLHAWQSVARTEASPSQFDHMYNPNMTEAEILALSAMEAQAQSDGWAPHEVSIDFFDDDPGMCDLYARLVGLMRIFYNEEKQQYQTQTASSAPPPSPGALGVVLPPPPKSAYTRLHHAAVFQKSAAKLLECLFVPMRRALSNLVDANKKKLAMLHEEEERLRTALEAHSK